MRNEVKLANPNYDSSKIEEFKNVWVFCEQRQGQMMSTSYELISEGRKLADELGVKLCGLLVGDNVGDLAESIGGYGADEVIVCDHPLLKNYTTDAYAKVICDVISEMKPEAFLIGATNIGRDLGPRCAARLHTGLCADCTHLDVDMPIYKDFLRGASTLPEAKIDGMATAKVMGKDHDVSRDLKMTRPAFGGNLMATIICPRFRPSMATVRPGVMKKAAYDEAKAKAVKVTKYDVKLDAADLQTEVVEVVKAAKKLVDLIGADYIVSVGRGISKDVEGGIKLAHELADVLGGVVGGDQQRHFLRQHLFQRFGFFIALSFRFVLIILLRLPQCAECRKCLPDRRLYHVAALGQIGFACFHMQPSLLWGLPYYMMCGDGLAPNCPYRHRL